MKWIEVRFSNSNWVQFKLTTQETERVLTAYKNQEVYCIFNIEGEEEKHYINMKNVLEIVILK